MAPPSKRPSRGRPKPPKATLNYDAIEAEVTKQVLVLEERLRPLRKLMQEQ